MVSAVRGSQGKSGKNQKKVREFYISKSGKNNMTRESQGKS